MSQLTLYTDLRFPCPQRLQLVILELGLDITDVHEVDIIRREQQVCDIDIAYTTK
jgi:glutathione S-transferase